MIPLAPSVLLDMWRVLRPFEFVQTHGAFLGQDVYDVNVKERIRESMRIQVTSMLPDSSEHILNELV